jgi:serine/threonine protein kinase/phage FluMu protein Com
MIAFSCPHCNAALQVDESSAGTTGPCPRCRKVVQTPARAQQSGAKRGSGSRTLSPSSAAEDTAPNLPKRPPPPDFPFLAPAQQADELGRLGPYRVLTVLGTGAMGVVFRAEDPHLKRLVALKVMRPSLADNPEYHRRFVREAQLAAAIDHEHIVTVYHVGEDRGVPFLAMKLLQGETLEERLNRSGGRLPPPEVLRIGREVAEGLAAAHAQGLIHRDIKPANIWLEAGRDRVKIVDFGLARGTSGDAQVTEAGAVIGTPSYMAPEQANAAPVDHRCDLFSLGAVLYRASTGKLPFGDRDTLSVLSALATRTPPPPYQITPAVPRAFSRLIMGLLAKDPANRPQSARQVVEGIDAIEQGEPAEDAAPSPAEATPSPRGGKKKEPALAPARVVEQEPEKPSVEEEEKKRAPKKTRPSGVRRKKRTGTETDWGRVVFVGSLVFLGVAVLLLLIVALRHVTKARAAGPDGRPPNQNVRLMSPGGHTRCILCRSGYRGHDTSRGPAGAGRTTWPPCGRHHARLG